MRYKTHIFPILKKFAMQFTRSGNVFKKIWNTPSCKRNILCVIKARVYMKKEGLRNTLFLFKFAFFTDALFAQVIFSLLEVLPIF